ncbi:MAG: hypothetical protein AAF585_07345 [Verrucomicrobiota bacterium]
MKCSLPSLWILLSICISASAETHKLDDFDGDGSLGQRWTASGEIQASREPLEGAAPENGPAGNVMRLSSEGNFALYTKIPTADEIKWAEAEKIAFWVYQEEAVETRIDVLALEPDRKAFFWRKCTFSEAGWQRIELPLAWFRWENLRLPRWEQVRLFGIRGSGAMNLRFDGFELIDADPDAGANYSLEDLTELAFPDDDTEKIQVVADDRAWVLTNSPEIDAEQLHEHLAAARTSLENAVPSWRRPAGRHQAPRLIVFHERKDYAAFFERMGEKISASITAPSSGGYHVQGIGVSYFSEEHGTLRPVFLHEFIHSFGTFVALQGSSGGDWFQEGLANLMQMRVHPQPGLSKIIEQGLDNENYRDSLEDLTSGGRISGTRYWQALSFLDCLMRDEKLSENFPDLLKEIELSGSSDLSRHLEQVYGLSFEEIEGKNKYLQTNCNNALYYSNQ